MLGRRADDAEPAILKVLPPVELDHTRDSLPLEPALEAERHHEDRVVAGGDARDRAQVEVIEVVVRQNDHVDGRQVLEGEPRGLQALRPREGYGARPPSPVRIREQVDPVELQEHRRVPDPGHRGLGAIRAKRGAVIGLPGHIVRPGTSPGPLPDEGEAGGSRRALEGRVGIAETALDVMGGLPGNRLLGTCGQGTGGQETDEQEGPRADSHGQRVYRGTRGRATAVRPTSPRCCRSSGPPARARAGAAACAGYCG